MDKINQDLPPDGGVEASSSTANLAPEALPAPLKASGDVGLLAKDGVEFPPCGVDDVNPALARPHDSLNVMQPGRSRNPSGMLMGPNDPFFQEAHAQSRGRTPGQARYDLIGPFGREPDPDIELPPGTVPPPRKTGGFPPPGPGGFGGMGGMSGPFGGFFP